MPTTEECARAKAMVDLLNSVSELMDESLPVELIVDQLGHYFSDLLSGLADELNQVRVDKCRRG